MCLVVVLLLCFVLVFGMTVISHQSYFISVLDWENLLLVGLVIVIREEEKQEVKGMRRNS